MTTSHKGQRTRNRSGAQVSGMPSSLATAARPPGTRSSPLISDSPTLRSRRADPAVVANGDMLTAPILM